MAEFSRAILKVLANEGNYSSDPNDRGGATKFGISQKSFPDLDIKNLSIDQAKQIYHQCYWEKICGDQIENQLLADKILDLAVNLGISRITKMIQKIVGTKIDGHMGPATIQAINAHDPVKLLTEIRKAAIIYYKSLNQPKFIRGWTLRLERD
jgi:lysozyme family protein